MKGNMIKFMQHFKDFFNNPEEKKETEEEAKIGEKQRLDALHTQARTQLKKKKETKKPVSYTF